MIVLVLWWRKLCSDGALVSEGCGDRDGGVDMVRVVARGMELMVVEAVCGSNSRCSGGGGGGGVVTAAAGSRNMRDVISDSCEAKL
ncbi:hypothetical protein E2C01_070394 [Portunus trituberculatus]|uniref:Uncharacterized protein n=1 Tax=Portunus trituberculatus TaxID=210409 RepID=A0A5B7I166_PORTR|nr:hypothetical protein [Portunus trituberculatus]